MVMIILFLYNLKDVKDKCDMMSHKEIKLKGEL